MNKYTKIATPIALFASIWAILFLSGRYMLYLQEQLQLFQNDWNYVLDNCTYNAGFAQMVTEFVIQFCHIPWLGTAIMAAIITTSIYAFKCVIKKISDTETMLPIAIIPFIPMIYAIVTTEGTFPFIQFTISIFVTAIVLSINQKFKAITATIVSPLLFWIAGAPAILLPVFVLIQSIAKSKKIAINTIPLIVYMIFGYIGIRTGVIGSLDHFINYTMGKAPIPGMREYRNIALIGWASAIAAVAMYVAICKYLKEKNTPFINYAIQTLMVVIMLGVLHFYPNIIFAQTINFSRYNEWARLHYLYTQGEYKELLDTYKEKQPNSNIEANYINLALYREGKLVQDFFKYSPTSHMSLLDRWADTPFPIAFLWTEVSSEMGFIAKSTQTAYEGNVLSGPRGSSAFYKILAENEIIAGNYQTAEKYLKALENTIYYKEWANNQYQFLSNSAVIKNEYYNAKRKCISTSNSVMALTDELQLMKKIILQNPLHKSTFNFAALMTISSGVLPAFREVISAGIESRHFLPPYEETFQEAIIVAYNNAPIFWEYYKTKAPLQQEYTAFTKALKERNTNPMGSKAVISKQQNRYWYYIETLKERAMQQRAQNASTPTTPAQAIPNN